MQGGSHVGEEQRNMTCSSWSPQLSVALGHGWESSSLDTIFLLPFSGRDDRSTVFPSHSPRSELMFGSPVAGKWKGPGMGCRELCVLPETVMERPGGGLLPPLAEPSPLPHCGLKESTRGLSIILFVVNLFTGEFL